MELSSGRRHAAPCLTQCTIYRLTCLSVCCCGWTCHRLIIIIINVIIIVKWSAACNTLQRTISAHSTCLFISLAPLLLRVRLGVDGIALILQQNRLRWYGHVLRKDDDGCVKKCMEYEVEGSRPRGRPKRTWKEVVREDCQACKLNKEDAVDRCKWRKVIKEVHWSGCV